MKQTRFIIAVATVFALSLLASCHSTKHAAASGGGTKTEKVQGEGGGTSFADAVVIAEKTETEGVAAEYAWLKVHYPGYQTLSQKLVYDGGKPYDIIEIKTANGDKEKVYFDISNFFGKF